MRRLWIALAAASLAMPAAAALTQDWGTFAMISSTLGVKANRLCIGEGLRVSDIGCPSYAPSVTTAGDVSVTGNLSANKFIGDGSGLTGITADATDRIISGTNARTRIVAVSNTGFISITQNNGETAWFDPVRGLVTLGVSATGGISGTTGYFSGRVGIGTATPDRDLVVVNGSDDGVVRIGSSYGAMISGDSGGRGIYGTNLYADGLSLRTAGTHGSYGYAGMSTRWGAVEFYTAAGATTADAAVTPTTRMRITSGGNVGIGTDNPAGTLHVSSSSWATAIVQAMQNDPVLQLASDTTAGNAGWRMGMDVSDDDLLDWRYNNSRKMLLTTSGKLRVGDATIPAGGTLEVAGTISASNAIQVGSSGLGCGSSIAGALRYNTGNVQYCNGTSWTSLSSNTTAALDGSGSANHIAYWSDPDTLAYDSNQLYWDAANNNLGIGTITPSAALEVSGTVSATSVQLSLLAGDYGVGGEGGWASALDDLSNVDTSGAGTGSILAYDGSGWVVSSSTGGTIDGSGSANHVAYWSDSDMISYDSSQLYWNASSNRLGIGTATPGATLSVAGDVSISGEYYAGNGATGTPSYAFMNDTNLGMYRVNADILGFSTGGSERVRMSASGVSSSVNFFAPDGSASNPGYNFASDTDNGIFRPTTNEIGFSTAGSESMRITAAGNVAIGHSSPAGKLDVRTTGDEAIYAASDTGGAAIYGSNSGTNYGVRAYSASSYGIYSVSGVSWGVYGVGGNGAGAGGVIGYNSVNGSYGYLGSNNGYGVYCHGNYCGGNVAWTPASDARLKEKVATLGDAQGLDLIAKLRPVTFHWKDSQLDAKRGLQYGFIAQEVEKVVPEVVVKGESSMKVHHADGSVEIVSDTKAMDYGAVVVPLVKAVQQLKAANDNLAAENEALRQSLTSRIQELKVNNDDVRAELDALKKAVYGE